MYFSDSKSFEGKDFTCPQNTLIFLEVMEGAYGNATIVKDTHV